MAETLPTPTKQQIAAARRKVCEMEFDIRLHSLRTAFPYPFAGLRPISHQDCGVCGGKRDRCKHL